MSASKTKRLDEVVNQEMIKKRHSIDTKLLEERKKLRTFKLGANFNQPKLESQKIYLYSNIFGNQFILPKKQQQRCTFPSFEDVYQKVTAIHKEINKQSYKLWSLNKKYITRDTFYWNSLIINLSWALIILLFLAIALVRLFKKEIIEQNQQIADQALFGTIMTIIILNIILFYNTMGSTYKEFNFDEEIIKKIVQILKKNGEELLGYKVVISCDREITWICFKYHDENFLSVQPISRQKESLSSYSNEP